MANRLLILLGIICIFSCKENDQKNWSKDAPVFKILPSTKTGINFTNQITEKEDLTYIDYEAIYQGAGVGILDINNDGLQDLFFASNMQSDKIYLNEGNLKFKDITDKAGVAGGNEWASGVSIVDINADGFDDIYLSCHFWDDLERRRNKLYINNKNNTFTERAKEYGIDDPGYSIQSSFFDYDLDGDLDLFVANQPPNKIETRFNTPEFNIIYSCHLYKNENNKFTDVTVSAGVITTGFSLSPSIGDINNDGYPDIYVTTDYNVPDYLFLNNKNGTFTNITKTSLPHVSLFSMGSDIADINNDGWLDLISVDMVAEDHFRNKTNMAGMNINQFWNIVKSGFHYQYMFNTLHLNNGNGTFSDIAQMAGISKTDWSWAPLFADFDYDGQRDLFISNGILREIRNRDFLNYRNEIQGKGISKLEITKQTPSVKIRNYMCTNEGNLHFKNVADKWGMDEKSFSQGAVYADLDNDGDLDLIINNMNDPAFLYENQMNDNSNNYIRVVCKGENGNLKSLGARAMIYYDNGKFQIAENFVSRGYMSSIEPIIHFGMGKIQKIDSLIIRWPSGKIVKINSPKLNSTLKVEEKNSEQLSKDQIYNKLKYVYTKDVTSEILPDIRHHENIYDDFKKEILIPYKLSSLGPCLETADVNGDKNDDFFLGNGSGESPKLYIQTPDGGFNLSKNNPWDKYKSSETIAAHFFDFDNDGDLDLYTATGSNEYEIHSLKYLDHLYINNGSGEFTDASNKITPLNFSKAVVKSADIDSDGDLDLFIGGRQVPGQYGKSERSAILINERGKLIDQTSKYCPDLNGEFGMVSTAQFGDIDNDKDLDLILSGEWMNIKIFIFENGKFEDKSKEFGTEMSSGWWNMIKLEDLDKDGDLDIIAGNLGSNSKFKASKEKPFKVFLKDFDDNGTWDTYLGSYSTDGKIYPVRGKQCSSEQMPFIKDRFKSYNDFASKTIEEILEGKLDGAIQKMAVEFKSGIFINTNNKFEFKPFPIETQIAPINDIQLTDINEDNLIDIIYGGNYYDREVETTRSDAGVGGVILNKGNNEFESLHPSASGIILNGDLRKLSIIKSAEFKILLAANNNSKMQAYLLSN